jgi:hypothetical protein
MYVFPIAVFLLCLATSLVCLVLLTQGYLRSRNRLLLWSALCFVFLALNSGLVVLDILVFPGTDLGIYRQVAALCAVVVLLFGFIWDSGEDAT